MVDRQLTLKQMILQKVELKEYTFSELAPIAGYKGKNASGNFKRALVEDREFENFQCFVNLVEYIWKDEVVERVSQCATEVDPNNKCARSLLEYLSSNRSLEAFKTLLDRMIDCKNKESREWGKAYSIQYYCQTNYPNIDLDDVIRQAKSIKTCGVELKVFLMLIKTYAYNQKGNFYMPRILAEEISSYFDEIENGYIKDMYQSRICETMTYIELRVYNNPEESRKYSQRIIDSPIGKAFKAYAFFYQGLSYQFTSYEESLKFFNKSIQIYKELNRDWIVKDIEEKVEFLKVYWDKLEKPECKFIINYLLMNIKKGVNVGKLIEEKKDEIDEPMYLYLKGCNDKSYVTLIESVLKFVKKGDSFLGTLAKIELERLNYPNLHLIETLQEIRTT